MRDSGTLQVEQVGNCHGPNANTFWVDELRGFRVCHKPAQELRPDIRAGFRLRWFGKIAGRRRMHQDACLGVGYLPVKESSCEVD